MPSIAELIENIPTILSLILIEGLLSVDNSLAIAALASRLPVILRPRALTWGMIGAYGFRCICLLFAAAILGNRWLKLAGAGYLIYLMCKELTGSNDDDDAENTPDPATSREQGFLGVVVSILVLDASLSVDNVVAAVAMTPRLWVVYLGVGIGILALRFVAGYCIKLIERFPILEATAFLLVGFVGILLVCEMELELHVGPAGKFVGILSIMAASLVYDRVRLIHVVFAPLVRALGFVMLWIARIVHLIFWPVSKPVGLLASAVRARMASPKGPSASAG